MKKEFYLLTFILGLLSCNGTTEKVLDNASITSTSAGEVKFHTLEKLYVVGDFNGDKKQDTVFQHNYSKLTRQEIERSADPFQNPWDTVVEWFYHQQADVYLTMNKGNQDTLHLGVAQGLYCLINIGDNNADGKDEMALVIDYLDYSRVNSCKIVALCNDHWEVLKQFDIHEDAFNFSSDKAPLFGSIKEFLEHQNGKWVYKDYAQISYDSPEDVGKMQVLKLEKCN